MKLGGEYRLRTIGPHQWKKLSQELRLDPDAVRQRVKDLAGELGDRVSDVTRRLTDEGLTHALITRLADALTARAAACRTLLD